MRYERENIHVEWVKSKKDLLEFEESIKPDQIIKNGRNKRCYCGSGKKFKNCCMK
ncbi:MAG: SEC-C domain-containing protein [Magnetococcales bacterium]|nr:SEC-C domain-containing protein [Magnetococcales bacterium]